MDKKMLGKVSITALLVFLFGWLMVNTYFSSTNVDIDQLLQNDLNNFHSELVTIEKEIATVKPQCAKLDSLREDRKQTQLNIDAVINRQAPVFTK